MHYEVVEGILPHDTLLVHGNLGSNAWWEPALGAWSAQNRGKNLRGRAILAEWRGCGQSGHPRSKAEIELDLLAQDYLGLVDFLGARNSHIIGHSLGGMITLKLLLKAPEKFSRAAVLNSLPARGYHTNEKKYQLIDRMRADRKYCETVLAATILNVHQLSQEYFSKLCDAAFQTAEPIWRGIPEQIEHLDIRIELSRIKNPLLVLHGALDYVVPVETSQEIADLVPNGKLQVIASGGHSLNIENPSHFTKLIDEFLFTK